MTQPTLYFVWAICSIAFVGIVGYVAYHLVKTLQSAKRVLDDMQDITHDVQELKNTVKTDVIGKVIQFSKIFFKK